MFFKLLVPVPIQALIVPITAAILAVQVWGSYRLIVKIFKWLSVALFAYIAAAFFAKPHWGDVLQATVRPSVELGRGFLGILVGDLRHDNYAVHAFLASRSGSRGRDLDGPTAARRSRRRNHGRTKNAQWDVAIGMLLSNVVMYFIMLATASTLARSEIQDIQTAADEPSEESGTCRPCLEISHRIGLRSTVIVG